MNTKNSMGRITLLAGATALVAGFLLTGAAHPALADGTDIGGVIPEDPSGTTNNTSTKDAAVDAAVAAIEAGGDPGGTVTYKSVDITGQMQQEPAWCVPASVRATLTAFGVTQYQSDLAPLLKTTSSGTAMSAISPVLNKFESKNPYVLNGNTSSGNQLFARVKVDVDDYKAPIIVGIQGGDLPLWNAAGYTGYHAITLYGYANNNAWVSYDDPIDISSLYGRHVTNKSFLISGLQDEQDYIVW